MAVPQNALQFRTALGELVKQYEFALKNRKIRACCGTVITVPYIGADRKRRPPGLEGGMGHSSVCRFDTRTQRLSVLRRVTVHSP